MPIGPMFRHALGEGDGAGEGGGVADPVPPLGAAPGGADRDDPGGGDPEPGGRGPGPAAGGRGDGEAPGAGLTVEPGAPRSRDPGPPPDRVPPVAGPAANPGPGGPCWPCGAEPPGADWGKVMDTADSIT
jgi:hypothetical protein